MSFYCIIRSFAFDQLDVIYAGPDRSFYCAIRAFAFDQLDVIYAGPDRSFYCIIRAFTASFELLGWILYEKNMQGHMSRKK